MADSDDCCNMPPARPPRFYAPDLQAQVVPLSDGEAHHARSVLRLKAGEAVELFDGAGCIVRGRVTEISRGNVRVSVEHRLEPIARPQPLVEIAFAVPRGRRVDILLEKATELGAVSLQPIIFERSITGGEALSPAKRQRWEGHCVAAAKQCGLSFLPTVHDPCPLSEYVARCQCDHKLVGDVDEASRPLAAALAGWRAGRTICLLVGPEGDLSPDEWPIVREGGFVGVHLGHTTLRVETAAIALLAGVTAICDGLGA